LLAAVLAVVAAGGVCWAGATVRPEVWPTTGTLQSREGKPTDNVAAGAGVTLAVSAANPGTTWTLYAKATAGPYGANGLLFYGNSGAPLAMNVRRIISVSPAGEGGEYNTIAGGIAAGAADLPTSVSRSVVLVSPGTYVESRLVLPDWVDLIGVDRESCVIAKDDGGPGPGWDACILRITGSNMVANLTVRNLHNAMYDCVYYVPTSTTGKTIRVYNCTFDGGTLGFDTLIVWGGANDFQIFDSLIIGRADTFSVFVPAGSLYRAVRCRMEAWEQAGLYSASALYLTGAGNLVLDSCVMWNKAHASCAAINFDSGAVGNTASVYFNNCSVRLGEAPGRLVFGTINGSGGGAWHVYLSQTGYATTGLPVTGGGSVAIHEENLGSGDKTSQGAFDVGSLKVAGTEVISAARVLSNVTANADILTRGTLADGRFPATLPAASGANLTNLDASDLASGTVADGRLSSNVALKNGANVFTAAQATSGTEWDSFPAVACAGPSLIVTTSGPSEFGWQPGWNGNVFLPYLYTTDSGALAHVPVPYRAGSIVTRLGVKWQAGGAEDGLKLRMVKRDESGTATAWTTVGAQQTYTDAGAPYDVTVSEYDLPDETLASNYSYAVEVESVVTTASSAFIAVRIETGKRVY